MLILSVFHENNGGQNVIMQHKDAQGTIVRPALYCEMSGVCDTLAAGFFDDRLFQFMFPEPDRRKKYLPRFFAPYVELALSCGLVLVSGAEAGGVSTPGASFAGAVVTYGPGLYPGGPALNPEINARLNEQVYQASGPDAPRATAVMDALTALHPKTPQHEYLLFIAVCPEHRGKGVGAMMLTYMSRTWDALGHPAYLESTTERSTKGIYHQHGWRPCADAFSPANGPNVFPLWRDPDART